MSEFLHVVSSVVLYPTCNCGRWVWLVPGEPSVCSNSCGPAYTAVDHSCLVISHAKPESYQTTQNKNHHTFWKCGLETKTKFIGKFLLMDPTEAKMRGCPFPGSLPRGEGLLRILPAGRSCWEPPELPSVSSVRGRRCGTHFWLVGDDTVVHAVPA